MTLSTSWCPYYQSDLLNCSLLSVVLSLLTGVPVCQIVLKNKQIFASVRGFIPKKSIDPYKVNRTFVQPFIFFFFFLFR